VKIRVSLKSRDRFTERCPGADGGFLAARTRQFGKSKRRRRGWQ